jgi:hypothetical protein
MISLCFVLIKNKIKKNLQFFFLLKYMLLNRAKNSFERSETFVALNMSKF